MNETAARPTAPSHRYEILDALRGFALLGVTAAIWYGMGVWKMLSYQGRQALPTAGFDTVVQALNALLVDDKFYTLFSILFGLGFALQLQRAKSKGRDILPTYHRRLVALFVIGILHALFLYYGDILHVYALLGLLLVAFRKCSNRALLGWALAAMTLSALVPFLEAVTLARWPGALVFEIPELTRAEALSAARDGGWLGILQLNAMLLAEDYGSLWDVADWYLGIFGRFLFGFYIGRCGLLLQFKSHLGLYRKILPWAAVLGLAGNGLHVALLFLREPPFYLPGAGLWARLAWVFVEASIVALALSYVCVFVLFWTRPAGRRLLGALAPLGRMALTNYLGQSMVFVFLFYGVGVGLAGRVGIGIATLLAVAVFLLQIPFSRWWLDRYRFGPAEWIWRCVTYGTRIPIRKVQPERV